MDPTITGDAARLPPAVELLKKTFPEDTYYAYDGDESEEASLIKVAVPEWTDEAIQAVMAVNSTNSYEYMSGISIWMLVAENDAVCTKEQAALIASQLGSRVAMTKVYPNADHTFFTWSNQSLYMEELRGFLGGSTAS